MKNALPDVIRTHLASIQALCREYGVAQLELFGSAARADFDPARSDLDFLVTYREEADLGPWLGRYFELGTKLEALLGRPVDLVMAGSLHNPYLIRSINRDRTVLYAA